MAITKTDVKVEARNSRTVALNELSYFVPRLDQARALFIAGYFTKSEYQDVKARTKARIAESMAQLNAANVVLTWLR